MSQRAIRPLLAIVLLLAGLFGGMAVAAAQDAEPSLVLRRVDSREREAVELDFIWTGNPGDVDSLQLTENGEPVEIDAVEPLPQGDRAVVFVVDASRPMDESGALIRAKEAIAGWVEDAPDGTQFALVGAGEEAVLLENLTANESQMINALDQLGPQDIDGAAIWSSVQLGAATLRAADELQPNLVVISGSNDPGLTGSKDAAQGEVINAGATTFGVVYTGSGADPSGLEEIVEADGGFFQSSDDGSAVGGAVESFQTIVTDQQFRIVAASATAVAQAQAEEEAQAAAEESGQPVAQVNAEPVDYVLTVGGQEAEASIVLGGVAEGEASLNPTKVSSGGGIAFLQGGLGLILTIGVTLAAGILLAYGITSIFVQDDSLGDALRPYSEAYSTPAETNDEDAQLGTSAVIQRAVAITEQFAESQGYLARAEGALERANMPLRAGEALFFYAAIVLLVTVGGLALTRNLLLAIILGGLAALVPVAVVNFKASSRKKRFLSQLPDTLQLLSGTLRAGYSLMQGVEAVSQEVDEPMGYELRRVVTESRLGRPLEEALDSAAERMDSADFGWAVMAIRIQREVGGNLSELLLTVADTMVQRERLRRDVAALTAEGRVSAIVLSLLPPGLGAVMFVINPEYTSVLFEDTMGIIMVVVAVISMLIGFVWMKKIIDIEI